MPAKPLISFHHYVRKIDLSKIWYFIRLGLAPGRILSCRRNPATAYGGNFRGGFEMRLLFGIVLGAILTVGAAYYRDTTYVPSGDRPVVNWDVASQIAGNATATIRREIDRLLSR
jgi:hypothetical protein